MGMHLLFFFWSRAGYKHFMLSGVPLSEYPYISYLAMERSLDAHFAVRSSIRDHGRLLIDHNPITTVLSSTKPERKKAFRSCHSKITFLFCHVNLTWSWGVATSISVYSIDKRRSYKPVMRSARTQSQRCTV